MRKNKIKKKTGKIFFAPVMLIAAAVFLLAVFFGFSKTLAFSNGWAKGIWNNSLLQYISGAWQAVDNPAGSPPTIGWLKSSSFKGPCYKDADYEVYFQGTSTGENVRDVRGKAWFGIGSKGDSPSDPEKDCQDDLPSLGWLDFGADPGALCSGQSDCHAVQWHKTGSDNYTGYLDGYAHIRSMEENGWVRLRGSNNGEKYAVTMDSSEVLSGYAWNSGIETDPSLVGNQGLGWIKMDGLQIAECNLDYVRKPLCEGEYFKEPIINEEYCLDGATCTPNLDAQNHFTTWTCTRGCGSKPGAPQIIPPEYGKCGSINYICDKSNSPVASKLCASGTPSTLDTSSALVAKWTCGNDCGEKVECSAASRCGWIETAP